MKSKRHCRLCGENHPARISCLQHWIDQLVGKKTKGPSEVTTPGLSRKEKSMDSS
jgi:hypothetical protein